MRPSHPPMGWNSWDCFGTTVTEHELLANAEVMAARLLPSGWNTIVCDIQWYEPAAKAGGYNDNADLHLDSYGRPLPVPQRFPSATTINGTPTGFTHIAHSIHAKGLAFGVHLMRGIPRQAVTNNLPIAHSSHYAGDVADTTSTCPWNTDNYGVNPEHPGAQDWYDALIDQLASWGIDFLKIDDMLAPYHAREIELVHRAIARAEHRHNRTITLSLSPGTRVSLTRRDHLAAHATMWRISDDLWDRWEDITAQIDRLALWAPHQTPGAWADADMLPLGRIGVRAERGQPRNSALTITEQRTLMSAWTLAQSPLMMGGDLATSSDVTFELLTNSAVLEHYRQGIAAHCILAEGKTRVWLTPAHAPTRHVAVMNLDDTARTHIIDLDDIAAPHTTSATDVWTGRHYAVTTDTATHPYRHIAVTVPAHGVAHLALTSSR